MPRLILLFARFGDQYTEEAMKWLHALSNRLFGRDLDHVFMADNDSATADEAKGIPLGTNYAADFSAWERALQTYTQSGPRPDDVLFFANDSFYRNFGTGILRYFLDFGGDAILEGAREGIVGVVDDFPKPVEVLGFPGQKWVRSNFFFVSQNAFQKIGRLAVTKAEADSIFASGAGAPFFKPSAPLSENYQVYMRSWLFGEEDPRFPEYGIHWFRSEPLTDANRADFIRKFIAILSEHSFSFSATSKGLKLTNVNPLPWPVEAHTKSIYEVHDQHFSPLKIEDL